MTALYFTGAIVIAVISALLFFFLKGEKGGGTAVEAKVAEKTAEALGKQADAAANAPQGKVQIIDRLRNGGGL